MGNQRTSLSLISDLDKSKELRQASRFRYEPLPDDQSFRLLILEPGERHESLRGTLKVISLRSSDFGSHETISYVWGNGTGVQQILICDRGIERAVKLTANLYEGLVRLRLPDVKRIIWVDQICIDQENLKERGHQVQFMNQLYRDAEHVLVWLGPDTEGVAESTFNFVVDLDHMLHDETGSKSFHVAYTKDLERQSRDSWVHLDRLMKLEWFNRGWIVQEIGTRASATLTWGEAEIDWLILCRVCRKLQNYYHFRSQFNIRTDEVRYLSHRFVQPPSGRDDGNRFNFIYELHRARRLKFSDERDRVFAWLGHFSLHGFNHELSKLEANYKESIAEAYIDVAKKALIGESSNSRGTALIALAAVQHQDLKAWDKAPIGKIGQHDHKRVELPSWVPDWRIFRSFMLTEPDSPHFAHGTSLSKVEICDNSLQLRICGLEIDTVEACSRPFAAREFSAKTSSTNLEPTISYVWREICLQNRFDLSPSYVNGESALFACMQTLGDGCVQIARRDQMEYGSVPKSRWLEHEAMYLTKAVGDADCVSLELRGIAEKASKEHDEEQWSRSANGATESRAFARTRKGYYVLGPGIMKAGDIVCVLFGGKMPFCLRPRGDYYQLVGECYVHGFMEGEAVRMAERQELAEKFFTIL